MKRALMLACAALCACSTPTTAPPADLSSPQSLAISGGVLFVASTNSDELRVLDLADDPNLRVFESAPNPLYVLSIPVVTRPIAVAADEVGDGSTGDYVFALSAVAARLGVVVVADRKERAEVALPGTPMSVVARTEGTAKGATAYVGITLGGGHGAIVKVDVPAPPVDPSKLSATIAYDLGDAAPAGLAISPDGKTLAIADRLADEHAADPAVRRGGLILLDMTSGNTRRVYVGGPASRVRYNPAVSQHQDIVDGGCNVPETHLEAGRFLYVLVESANCPLGQRCGGIQTVVDGAVMTDVDGGPLPPARIPGAPTDLAVASATPDGGNLYLAPVNCNATPSGEPPLLVAAPSTNGFVYFLGQRRLVDGGFGAAQLYDLGLTTPDAGDVLHLQPDGGALETNGGTGPQHGTIDVVQGGLESQTVVVTYQGILPGLFGRPATVLSGGDAGAGDTLTDPAADFEAVGVQPGDEVLFSGGASGCPATAVVASVAPGALGIVAGGTIDPGCFPPGGAATYTVRVGTTSAPYLVAGTVDGYLGRTADGSQSPDGGMLFGTAVPYYWRGPGYDPANPALSFVMGAGDPQTDAHWEFDLEDGVTPVSSGGGANAIQPGPVVWAPGLKKFYVGYPGSQVGSHVAEIDPAQITAGTSNTGVGTFE